MPSWYELREHARTQYELDRTEDDWFSLLWTYESGRTQQIVVTRYESFDQEWVEFRSFVCKEADMNPRVALRRNADLGLGALALDEDGDYALIHRAPLATMDQDEFALPLRALATIADQMEIQQTARDEF
ncbi:hypothetical protein ACFOOK_00570 [Micromonospora krabiensis]|uniref:Sensory transduction regulator n=1 Tax=Micromonospora krabiensis TaxID=307121 RepID=A0A1C3MXT2_9ACTN|nr:hypothetical protein [Micromonospora krabiensis]SBV25125.1 hypothetical protein GA0070620_0595 [Micromonospora krabiensis]